MVNWALWNKHQWNFNPNSIIFIKKCIWICLVCEMAAILSRPQCVQATSLYFLLVNFHCYFTGAEVIVCIGVTSWRHQMEAFSALLAICARNSPVPGEFPTQRPVTQSFDVFLDLRLNKRLSKQSWGRWFERLSRTFWRHRYGSNIGKRITRIRYEMIT